MYTYKYINAENLKRKLVFFHAWIYIISMLVCWSEFWHLQRKQALILSKWLFFQVSLGLAGATDSGKLQVWNEIVFWTFQYLKFMFSKKATKNDQIFTIDLTLALCSKCQIDGENFVNFCGLLIENMNFNKIFEYGWVYRLPIGSQINKYLLTFNSLRKHI